MIKKYALALLAFSSLNAERPTCENSPEPLTLEQIKYCENAQFFAALARQKSNAYDYFVQAALRQVNACLNTAVSAGQIQHIQVVIALELLTAHTERHTLPASARRVAGQVAEPFIKVIGTVIATSQAGQIITLSINNQQLTLKVPNNTAILQALSGEGNNSISLTTQQLSLWQNLTQTITNALRTYDPRNLTNTQLTIIGIVVAVEAGYFVYAVHKDMQEPLPLVFFNTKEDVNRYMEKHGFSLSNEQPA